MVMGRNAVLRQWRGWVEALSATLDAPVRLGRRRWTPVTAATGRRGPVDLLLASGDAFETIVTLPAAAERDLDAVVGHEIARHVPFAPDTVHAAHRIVARSGDRMSVRLAVLPKRERERLADLVVPGRLRTVAVDGDGGPLPVWQATDGWRSRIPDVLLLLLAIAVTGAALTWPVLREREAITQITAEIEGLRDGAAIRAVAAGRREALAAAIAALDGPSVTLVLERLSAALPDDAWVRRLRLDGAVLELEGTAASAGDLIARLERLPDVRAVAFAAPAVVEPGLGLERFKLRLDLRTRTDLAP